MSPSPHAGAEESKSHRKPDSVTAVGEDQRALVRLPRSGASLGQFVPTRLLSFSRLLSLAPASRRCGLSVSPTLPGSKRTNAEQALFGVAGADEVAARRDTRGSTDPSARPGGPCGDGSRRGLGWEAPVLGTPLRHFVPCRLVPSVKLQLYVEQVLVRVSLVQTMEQEAKQPF
ncbi:hypothetical protein NDU88_007207 [Pleurodeles waltl]|uniref:Uncharacterized protein n=1 Tax=Pleurodeles waltl TaxID=8319 RepID=A0AAV7VP27_PLEWA|nr:hypothetical protein NDU88_007207 [Pleurodeles waltl]